MPVIGNGARDLNASLTRLGSALAPTAADSAQAPRADPPNGTP